MKSITITTLRPVTRPEADPLLQQFSPQVTETQSQTSVTPLTLFAEPGMIRLAAQLAGATRGLLQAVADDGHSALSVTVTLVLEDDEFTCRCGQPLATEIQRITGECEACDAMSTERAVMALEHLDEEVPNA